MSKRQQVKTFGFSQKIGDIGEEYWEWSDAEKAQHYTDATSIMRHICNRIYAGLAQAGETGDDLKFEFCGINHDKDVDEINNTFIPVDAHIHGVVTLSKKRDLNVIAQWIGLEKVRFEIAKGRYGKPNMLAYLIHAKDPDKYQYDPSEVETFGTFDYMAFCGENKKAWERRSATVKTKRNKESSEWLVKQVQQGLLTKNDIMEHDEYKYIYADNMRLINDAIQFYNEDKGFRTLKSMRNGEFELTVLFVTGDSNAGKTATAKLLTKYLETQYGWETYDASASNPFDGYSTQEIIFLDDVRPYSVSASQWLQMLDPLGAQALGARYYNKMRAYRVVVMTSPVEDPYTFFSQVRGDGGEREPLDQFIRRLNGHIHVVRAENGDRYAHYDKIGRSEHTMLYDGNNHRFITNRDTDALSNGVPFLTENENADYKEHYHGPRMLNFGAVPYSEGFVESEAKDISQVDGVMADVLRDIKFNNDPELEHGKERPSMREIQGERTIKDGALAMGFEFGKRKKGEV